MLPAKQTRHQLPFWRGEGCLNTFILFDLIGSPELYTENFIQIAHQALLAEQRDDALIILPTKDPNVFEMRVLEPDGSFASFCGNGSRVVAAYLIKSYGLPCTSYFLACEDGIRTLSCAGDDRYEVDMLRTLLDPGCSRFVANAHTFFNLHQDVWKTDLFDTGWYFTQTGEPHLVTFALLSNELLEYQGAMVNNKYRHLFPYGISLNVVQIIDDTTLAVTTYERGVLRITASCGSGATSATVLAHKIGLVKDTHVRVITAGGQLEIIIKENKIHKIGPANIELAEPLYLNLKPH